jgi:hypothetical protein
MRNIFGYLTVVLSCFLVHCSSSDTQPSGTTGTTGTGTGSGGAGGEGTGSGGTGSGGAGGAASTKTPIERFCAAHCIPESNCATSPASICYAALSTEANLEKLEACATEGKCSTTACGIGSSAAAAFLQKCQAKVGSCSGSIGGFNADDCDDVFPLFRDDVIDAISTCFDKTCDAVMPCLSSAVKSKESAACSGI